MASKMPLSSVRGRIRQWIEIHADKLGDDVLEVGSRMTTPSAWWINNRDLARGKWTGMDMQAGDNVDVLADLHELPHDWTSRYSGVLCSEVLEHVRQPVRALTELRRVTKPGGWIVVTTLFAFPEHGFPDDYFRYSRSGLAQVLSEAGWTDIETAYAGEIAVTLDDHGEGAIHHRKIPMHVFAVARC